MNEIGRERLFLSLLSVDMCIFFFDESEALVFIHKNQAWLLLVTT